MPSAPTFGGFSLPSAGPSNLDQLSQAAGALPAMQAKREETKYNTQLLKAQSEAETQKNATARMGLFYRMLKNSQETGTQINPAVYQGLDQTAKELGLGSLVHTGPDGKPAVDMDALRRLTVMKLPSDMTDSERADMESASPGADREARLAGMGYDAKDFAPGVLSMAAKLTPEQQTKAVQDVATMVSKAFTTGESPEAIIAMVQAQAANLSTKGVDISSIVAMIDTQQFHDHLMERFNAAAMKMKQAGLKDEAIKDWYKTRAKTTQETIDDLRNYRAGELHIRQEQVDVGKMNAQTHAMSVLGNLQLAADRNTHLFARWDSLAHQADVTGSVNVSAFELNKVKAIQHGLETQLNDMYKQQSSELANLGEASPETLDQIKHLKSQIDGLKGNINAVSAVQGNATINRIQGAAGKPISTSAKGGPAVRTGTDAQGRRVEQRSDGNTYYTGTNDVVPQSP